MKRQTISRLVISAVLAVGIIAAFFNRGGLNAAALQAQVAGAGALGPLLFIAAYAAATVLFLPGAVITLAGGALFGPVWGTLYSLTGATAGATIAFLVARYLASDWAHRRAGGWTKSIIDGVEREGWRFIAFVRLVPLFPFNLLNYALGLTRIRLLSYIVGSFIFMLPGAFAYTYLGYAGREAAAGGGGLVRKGLLALSLLAMVAFLPGLIKRVRRKPGTGTISSDELKKRLEGNEGLVVLDVRSPADYTGELGHIAGSLNIPLAELAHRLIEIELQRGHPLAVICRTNRMSGKAVELLRSAGFAQALLVSDGMAGWKSRGFDTVREVTAVNSETRPESTGSLAKSD